MAQTLLLADDSVTIQRVIELTFADEDIDVVAVSDGDQAIARLDAMPPDILLVDVGMPGKSGYEVAAYVKQTPKLSHIPVVLLTGAFEPVDQARATAAGCDGVLAKPFEPQLVIERVKDLLGRPARPAGSFGDDFKAPPAPAPGLWPAAAQTSGETAAGSKNIDDYFDQLDAAFTSLAGKPPSEASTVRAASPAPVDVDWFGLQTAAVAAEMPDVPISREEPAQPFWTRGSEYHRTPESPKPPAPQELPQPQEAVQAMAPLPSPPPAPAPTSVQAPASAPSLPPLADAFAALLEAEQGEPEPSARPAWPAGAVSGAAVSDDLVEQVSRRVLDQLTDRVVRDEVSARVSAIAERLIREEIERIKSSIE